MDFCKVWDIYFPLKIPFLQTFKNLQILNPNFFLRFRDLPTRETEFLHRHDTAWEYGFYEPPLEKMDRNHLMLREALEVLKMIFFHF